MYAFKEKLKAINLYFKYESYATVIKRTRISFSFDT